MDRQLDVVEQTWERYVGSVTAREFLAPYSNSKIASLSIESLVEYYVESMRNDFTDIEAHADDIVEYLYRHLDTVQDAVLDELERLGCEDIPVFINGICLTIAGKNYHPSRLLDKLESLQTCEPSDLARAIVYAEL